MNKRMVYTRLVKVDLVSLLSHGNKENTDTGGNVFEKRSVQYLT